MTAMARLGKLLYVIYVIACGHPAGGRGDDFGFSDFARATCGVMSSARCVEILEHLFTRAAGLARKRRQRADAAPLDWADIVEQAENLKFGQLVGQQEAEATTRRIIKEEGGGGRKSPRRDEANGGGDDDEEPKQRKRGSRGGKAEQEKAAKREREAGGGRDTTVARIGRDLKDTHLTDEPVEAAALATTVEKITAAIATLNLNKDDFVVKNYSAPGDHGLKEETASNLFNKGVRLCFPEMQPSDAPCFFAWMGKRGCRGNAGKTCENCKRATKLGAGAVKPPKALMDAIKAKANESTRGLLK